MNNFNNYKSNVYGVSSQGFGVTQQVLRSTYLLLALSLIPTAIGALVGINASFMFLATSPILGSILNWGHVFFNVYGRA
jgi:FtsH-binding integral membrane protein